MPESKNVLLEQELLIRQLKEGSESAYEVLFKEYYVRLVIHASKFVEEVEEAKEIVQDLFVSIYEKRENLNITTSLNSYLYRAVRNRAINYINAQKQKAKFESYSMYEQNKSDDTIENYIGINELQSELYSAISELPEKCRLIFKLNRFEGLSNSDIAEKLELSKRTVETQISKALKLLRGKLQTYLREGVAILIISLINIL